MITSRTLKYHDRVRVEDKGLWYWALFEDMDAAGGIRAERPGAVVPVSRWYPADKWKMPEDDASATSRNMPAIGGAL